MALWMSWGWASSAQAQPTVYIVRHAEKVASWPGGLLDAYHPLSAQGVARAESLAALFEPGALAAIYSSRTTRTLHTALPLSQKLGIPILEAAACQDTIYIAEFLAEIAPQYPPGQAILIVSHSDVIPFFLIKAGLPRTCWNRLGIAEEPDGELLIEGYAGLWRMELSDRTGKDCAGIERREFWPDDEK